MEMQVGKPKKRKRHDVDLPIGRNITCKAWRGNGRDFANAWTLLRKMGLVSPPFNRSVVLRIAVQRLADVTPEDLFKEEGVENP